MSYQVLALKYRPQVFEDLVGQETVSRTLTSAIQKDRIANAFLFSGVRGVGKTTTARILAKALNCESGPTVRPCGSCPACKEITVGSSLDVMEIDGASNNGVEQVREIIEGSRYAASRDRFKIYIIDEVHMLTTPAFNALLKTLEEPPPSVKFIFATTELHKIPDTILSRCQEFEFRTVPNARIAEHLGQIARAEKIDISERALSQIARSAEGSLRDGMSALDQVIAASGENIKEEDVTELLGLIEHDVLLDTAEAIVGRDTKAVLEIVDNLVGSGRDLRHFTTGLLQCFRDVLVLQVAPQSTSLISYMEDQGRLRALAAELTEEDLVRSLDVLAGVEGALRWSPEPRFHLEVALLKLAQLRRLASFEELLARFENLEGIAGSTGGTRGPTGASRPTSDGASQSPAAKRAGGANYRRTRVAPATDEAEAPATSASSAPQRDGGGGAEIARATPEASAPVESAPSESSVETVDGPPPPAFEGYDQELSSTPPQSGPSGASVPASTEPVADSGDDPTGLVELWMDRLRARKPMLRALVSRHDGAILGDGVLELRFGPSESLIVDQLNGRDNLVIVEEELALAAGRKLRLQTVIRKGGTPEQTPSAPRSDTPSATPSPSMHSPSTPDVSTEETSHGKPLSDTTANASPINGSSHAVPADSPPPDDDSRDPQAAKEKAKRDPLVQRFVDTFKAEVEDVRILGPDEVNPSQTGPKP